MDLILSKKQTPIEIALDIDESGHTTAKKLYAWLDLRPGDYSRWVNQNIINNPYAENGTDYSARERKTSEEGGRPSVDYLLSASFAKKLAMSSRSPKGEETRNYFIKVENTLAEVAQKKEVVLTPAEMFLQNAQLMVEHERRLASIENKQEEMSSGLEQVENRLNAVEVKLDPTPGMNHFAIAGYVSLMKYMVDPDDYKKLGKEATKLSRERGYKKGHVYHPVFGEVGTYHTDILRDVFSRYFATH